MHVPIIGYMDATTGLSIGSRHGLGKVKHIDTVFLWVGKGQAHRYSISMGTRCRLGWKGKVVQEEHSRNTRGPVYKTLGFRLDENSLRQTQLPLLRRKTPFST